jgi:cytosine/adenosine deaminase-related metal-dependent hydrolase
LNPLELIRAATFNSAKTLRRPDLGLIQVGYVADLLVIAGNPPGNLRFLYALGTLDSADGSVVRRGGIRGTIKIGVVFDNQVLIYEVVDMGSESKQGWTNPVPPMFEPVFR